MRILTHRQDNKYKYEDVMDGLIRTKYPRSTHANDALLRSAGDLQPKPYALTDASGIPLKGADDEWLGIKLFVIGNLHAQHHIWITNGLHGIERYGGLIFLCWLLANQKMICKLLGHNICIIVVDDLNPAGASNHSRFDHGGVDNNRNFRKRFPRLQKLHRIYQQLDDDFHPKFLTPWGELIRLYHLRRFREKNGDEPFRKIINIGQWVHPEKILFIGKEPTWTNTTVRQIIREHSFEQPGHDVHPDFHTALGNPLNVDKQGDPLIVSIEKEGSLGFSRARWFFGPEVISTQSANGYTSSGTGTIEQAFFSELPACRTYTGVCIELGTKSIDEVIKAERWRHIVQQNNNKLHRLMHNWWSWRLSIAAFFPPDDIWRELVVFKIFPKLKRVIDRLHMIDEYPELTF